MSETSFPSVTPFSLLLTPENTKCVLLLVWPGVARKDCPPALVGDQLLHMCTGGKVRGAISKSACSWLPVQVVWAGKGGLGTCDAGRV